MDSNQKFWISFWIIFSSFIFSVSSLLVFYNHLCEQYELERLKAGVAITESVETVKSITTSTKEIP